MKIAITSVYYRTLLILLRATLDFAYLFFVSDVFGYAGFDLTFDILVYLESWIIFLILISMLNHHLDKPSDFLIFLLFTITIIPMLSLFGLSDQDRLYTYLVSLVFLLIVLVQRGPDLKIPYIKNGTFFMLLISMFVIGISLVKMTTSGAIFRINFDLSKVYDFREEVGDTLFEGLWAYIVPWTSKIFTMVLLAYALLQKRYILVLGLIIFQILLFGITSHKAVALYPIFAISLYMFRNSKYIMLMMSFSIILLLILCMATYFIFENGVLPSLLIRRLFFVPALLKYNYYDFFSMNGYVYWSNSIFSSFIDYPFHLPPDNLIASVFYGSADMGANTGFMATSYMHFGFPGMFAIGLIVAVLLKITDAFANGDKDNWFFLSFVSVPFFGLFANAALLTTLLTHGLGVGLIMAWFSYSKKRKRAVI